MKYPRMSQNPNRRATIASFMLAASAVAAYAMTPHIKLAQINGGIDLEMIIPREFGAWKLEKNGYAAVINPQTEELLKSTYNQTLTRTYINPQGVRIMVSIAYGEDQSDTGTEIHHPEICYPAQGFQLLNQAYETITTKFGDLRLKRLHTRLGTSRTEPVTYWIVIGREIALTGLEKRQAELRHGLRGEIIDGLLFRLSTIDSNPIHAYLQHDLFTRELIEAVKPDMRERLFGLK